MKIGIFDSGIGGLTVLHEALKWMPDEEYVYFADTYHVPYGTKSKDEVKKLIFDVVAFLDSQEIDALLIACNTATSIAVADLRKMYGYPIIGMEPAVKSALKENENKKVLVLATPLTLSQEKYNRLVHDVDVDQRVESLASPELVEFAEGFIFDKERVSEYLKKALVPYDLNEFGTIVLGCTHFVYFKELIKELLPAHIQIVDGNLGTVKHMKNLLSEQVSSKKGSVEFYQSTSDGNRRADFSRYMALFEKNIEGEIR